MTEDVRETHKVKAETDRITASLYTIRLPDADLTLYDIRNEQRALDTIKDYIENGEIYL